MARLHLILLAALLAAVAAPAATAQKPPLQTAPEAFTAPLHARTGAGVVSATLRVQIDRYTPPSDRRAMTDALKYGGYPAFLQALRKAPAIGRLSIGDQMFTLRWAREQPAEAGRAISLVTDTPVYFVGGNRADARPRAGFELAVVQLTVDDAGVGTGTIAAAARVKPDGNGGVVHEDYAADPIALTSVERVGQ
jgi:hypothetical protein